MAENHTETILYVDDDESSQLVVSRHLRTAGFCVRPADTGRRALELVREKKPDLVLLDVQLPDMTGFDVCRELKGSPSTAGIPVLHLSGCAVSHEDQARGLGAGADGYLVKPVEPQVLIAHVRAHLRVRRAEELAYHAARQWCATFDAVRDGICLLNEHDRVVRCNRAFAAMVGKPFGDLVGVPYREALAGLFSDGALPRTDGVRQSSQRLHAELTAGRRRFTLSVDPVLGEDGSFQGAVHLFADVTEARHLEEQLRESQKLESVGRLAGGIAHEFNNLLTIILGYGQLLLDETPPENPSFAAVDAIRKAGERAADLTQQLLAYGRRLMLAPTVLRLNDLLEELAPVFRRLAGDGVELSLDPGPGLWPVTADPGKVENALMNLVLNARDAMPRGGRLRIATANAELDEAAVRSLPGLKPGPHLRLEVRDDGVGIDPKALGHVFDPFFTTKAVGEGRGLGLASVYGFVKQCGGHIAVASEPQKGSTFTIYLPATLPPSRTERT